jgi:hypothetical protein
VKIDLKNSTKFQNNMFTNSCKKHFEMPNKNQTSIFDDEPFFEPNVQWMVVPLSTKKPIGGWQATGLRKKRKKLELKAVKSP